MLKFEIYDMNFYENFFNPNDAAFSAGWRNEACIMPITVNDVNSDELTRMYLGNFHNMFAFFSHE